jgi:hypothetical protein
MNGDFKGDFTRDTFHLFKGFSRVLMQQGRVQLDADWNEQADILLWLLRRLAKDVIGPQGTPETNPGFVISPDPSDTGNFLIGRGEYYVDGILIENKGTVDNNGQPTLWSYKNQPFQPGEDLTLTQQTAFLVYLDVWERQVSFIEDDNIREVALGVTGPDTATRAQVVWQVKALTATDLQQVQVDLPGFFKQLSTVNPGRFLLLSDLGDQLISDLKLLNTAKDPLRLQDPGKLRARAKIDASDTNDACIIPPDVQYRGAENQLYRVEIHNGGPAWPSITPPSSSTRKVKSASGGGSTGGATFKWSRENGSVVFPIVGISDRVVTLTNLGRDDRSTLEVGDWVEVVDDTTVFQVCGDPDSQPYPQHPLLQVQLIHQMTMEVTLNDAPAITIEPGQPDKHPLLRRWDQRARATKKKDETPDLFDTATGTVRLVEGTGEIVGGQTQGENETNWITLEDGVQIQFQSDPKHLAVYRPGDYWLIPARVITGDVEWPREKDGTHKLLAPHGVEHHLAALAFVTRNADGSKSNVQSAPVTFKSLVHLSN